MAKKVESVSAPAKRPPGRPKLSDGGGRRANVNFRCSPAWRDWLAAFGESEGETVSDLVAAAVEVYARLRRFDPPPER